MTRFQEKTGKIAVEWKAALWQPRIALSAAMTIFSITSAGHLADGRALQRIRASHWSLQEVWSGTERQALRVKEQALHYYDDVQLVYRIAQEMRSLEDQKDVPEWQGETDLCNETVEPERERTEKPAKPDILMAHSELRQGS